MNVLDNSTQNGRQQGRQQGQQQGRQQQQDKYRTQIDRVNIVLDIVKQLKNYPTATAGETTDIYKEEYIYVQRLKKVFTDYIKQPQDNLKQFKGTIFLEETVKRDVEYILPILKSQEPLFVIRMKTKRA
jgi:hypothetical protein